MGILGIVIAEVDKEMETPHSNVLTLSQLTVRSEQGGACECDQVPHQPDPDPGGGARRRSQDDGSLPHPVRAAAGAEEAEAQDAMEVFEELSPLSPHVPAFLTFTPHVLLLVMSPV